jgi:CHAT domain-containing protein
MKEIRYLCKTIDQLTDHKAWDEALTVGRNLWRISRDANIAERKLRLTCASTLFKVADLFLHIATDPYQATLVLRRAYELGADEDQFDLAMPSLCENAAHRLGLLFEQAKCHRSAVFWFKRSLAFARKRPIQDHLLVNLYKVAWNLEFLKRHDEPRPFYDEILALLWPVTDDSLLMDRLCHLLPAAMYHLCHGDQQLGENVLLRLQSLLITSRRDLPGYFAAGLFGLGNFYLANHRHDDAIGLARLVMVHAKRFGKDANQLRHLMHGLIARAVLQNGEFEFALAEIEKVFDLNPAVPVAYGREWFVDNLELWRDVARIRAQRRDFVGAANAYETLAQALGVYAADWQHSKTARTRMAFVRQQANVVHELVSVWLTMDDLAARRAIDLTVANALLQLKANQFLATQGNRLVTFRDWEGVEQHLFEANRRFAAAARRVAADSEDLDAALKLDDALFAREQLEGRMVSNAWEMLPSVASIFHYDFRNLSSVKNGEQTLLDYSLVEVCPPKQGLAGLPLGRHYVGVRLSSEGIRVEDVGPEEEIDALSLRLIAEMARRPVERSVSLPASPGASDERHISTNLNTLGPRGNLSALAEQVYRKVVKPMEPIGKSVVVAPDGALASLPFHALVRDGRYLIEDVEVSNCHSLLQEEALARRQMSPGMRIPIDAAGVNRDIVLLGDPDYSSGYATPLPNTRVEVEGIASLLISQGWPEDKVHKYVGTCATASRVAAFNHPRVLHVAAHGAYRRAPTTPVLEATTANGYSWRRWEEQGSATLSELDQALLRAELILSPQTESHEDPAAGRLLTGLELSSLDLIACRLAVLSACESGIGQPERGAGVLGFQYALLASFAHAGLVSLWSVPDRETSDLMDAFYRRLIASNWEVRPTYLTTLRHACRRKGQPVHPYYWAAFVLLGSVNR